jgi:hypothetical protein
VKLEPIIQPKKKFNMGKFIITEEEKTRIRGLYEGVTRKVLNEASVNPENVVTSMDFNALWNNFPNADEEEIFPGIFPNQYKQSPQTFQNACATRLCLALIKMGVECGRAFRSEKDWTFKGITYPTKGKDITTGAKNSLIYLTRTFGEPTIDSIDNTPENIEKYLKGNKGIFVITNNPKWPGISGHADIFNEKGKCGHWCYHGEGGKITAWVFGKYKGQNSSGGQQTQQTKPQQTQTQQTQPQQAPPEITDRVKALVYLEYKGVDRQKMINLDNDLLINWANAHIQNKHVFKNGDTYYNTQNASVANDQQAASQLINTVSSQPIKINF